MVGKSLACVFIALVLWPESQSAPVRTAWKNRNARSRI